MIPIERFTHSDRVAERSRLNLVNTSGGKKREHMTTPVGTASQTYHHRLVTMKTPRSSTKPNVGTHMVGGEKEGETETILRLFLFRCTRTCIHIYTLVHTHMPQMLILSAPYFCTFRSLGLLSRLDIISTIRELYTYKYTDWCRSITVIRGTIATESCRVKMRADERICYV